MHAEALATGIRRRKKKQKKFLLPPREQGKYGSEAKSNRNKVGKGGESVKDLSSFSGQEATVQSG